MAVAEALHAQSGAPRVPLGTGDWGLGLGDWGLGDWGLTERRSIPSGGPYEVEGWPQELKHEEHERREKDRACDRPARGPRWRQRRRNTNDRDRTFVIATPLAPSLGGRPCRPQVARAASARIAVSAVGHPLRLLRVFRVFRDLRSQGSLRALRLNVGRPGGRAHATSISHAPDRYHAAWVPHQATQGRSPSGASGGDVLREPSCSVIKQYC